VKCNLKPKSFGISPEFLTVSARDENWGSETRPDDLETVPYSQSRQVAEEIIEWSELPEKPSRRS
jgi:hypothetical protein